MKATNKSVFSFFYTKQAQFPNWSCFPKFLSSVCSFFMFLHFVYIFLKMGGPKLGTLRLHQHQIEWTSNVLNISFLLIIFFNIFCNSIILLAVFSSWCTIRPRFFLQCFCLSQLFPILCWTFNFSSLSAVLCTFFQLSFILLILHYFSHFSLVLNPIPALQSDCSPFPSTLGFSIKIMKVLCFMMQVVKQNIE